MTPQLFAEDARIDYSYLDTYDALQPAFDASLIAYRYK